MKTLIAALIILLFQFIGFAQTNNNLIKITDDVELIKISDNAYIHVSYTVLQKWGRVGANGLLFVNKDKAFLFDTPWTEEQTEQLAVWLKDSMGIEVIGFIPNHWHNDCMGGLNYILKNKIESYANQMTIDIAKANKLPIPKNGFTDSLELKLGTKSIKCHYLGAAHSMDNIAVWIPSEKILFPACMVKSQNSSNLGNTVDGDVKAYPETLSKLLRKFPSAKIVIPGHGKYGGTELIEHTLELTSK